MHGNPSADETRPPAAEAGVWTVEQLGAIAAAHELEIATRRPDGTLRRWLPIWVVCRGGDVYVRTWYRRQTGWFGHVLRTPRARIRVPGLEADVIVADLGAVDPELNAAVDAAYRAKYAPQGGGSVGQMVTDEAAATTLRLSRHAE